MDSESSTKFIGSLTKFLQSLCNGYVEFDDGVELIGHIYLSVDAGKTGKTLNYFLNEKVCKNDNSVTFISNSFHAQPEAKSKASSGKDGETRKEDGDVSDSGDVPKSTNVGTILSRPQVSSRSGSSPNQNRTGTKRPGSPLKGPVPSQRRASTPPSQRRIQSSAARGTLGSPVSKTVPSSPSSSSQDNIPSPSPARKSRTEIGHPTSNQSENVNADTENDIVPPNVLSINPTAEFASFLGSLTSDNQTSQDQPSPPDTKPDTDVTFIKEEFVSEPSSCAQAGSSGQHSGRSGEDNSGLYPVMLHQNTSVFPSTSAGYHAYQGGASATATSQHPGFPGTSSSQSDPFNPVAGTSQDGADPSDGNTDLFDTRHIFEPHGTVEDGSKQRRTSEKMLPTKTSNVHYRSEMRAATVEESLFLRDLSVNVSAMGAGEVSDQRILAKAFAAEISVVPSFNLPVQCPECSQVLSQARNLKRHYQVCHQATLFPCDLCNCSYNRYDNLQKHIRDKHCTQLACPMCRKICRSVSALEKHKEECGTAKS
ncbi:uncharacterized protein LOC143299655 isoform X3 [Babylonia areolata]|uniref:uncharacterized protein LOC143299655 isoform X3 n=1 Tax=Babylonia areolata TaxID=304850 RepID=UPI003FCF068F